MDQQRSGICLATKVTGFITYDFLLWRYVKKPGPQGQKPRSAAVESPQKEGCIYDKSQHASKRVDRC
jgi:hypothetical protein